MAMSCTCGSNRRAPGSVRNRDDDVLLCWGLRLFTDTAAACAAAIASLPGATRREDDEKRGDRHDELPYDVNGALVGANARVLRTQPDSARAASVIREALAHGIMTPCASEAQCNIRGQRPAHACMLLALRTRELPKGPQIISYHICCAPCSAVPSPAFDSCMLRLPLPVAPYAV